MNRVSRYPFVNIHRCESCKEVFEHGDKLVCVSDGWNDEDSFEVSNRHFWHRECFPAPVGCEVGAGTER